MDIVETINVLQDFNSAVIKSEIVGTVSVKSQLSGMPQCKLGLNEKFIQEIVNSQKYIYLLLLLFNIFIIII